MWIGTRLTSSTFFSKIFNRTLTKGEQETIDHVEHKRVPSFVLVVDERVDGITNE